MIPVSGLRWHTRVLLVSSLATLAAVLAGWAIFTLCAARLITSMYRGESWSVLNNLIRDRAHTPLEYYFESARVRRVRIDTRRHRSRGAATQYPRHVVRRSMPVYTAPRLLFHSEPSGRS
jgi:hypothetical protein